MIRYLMTSYIIHLINKGLTHIWFWLFLSSVLLVICFFLQPYTVCIILIISIIIPFLYLSWIDTIGHNIKTKKKRIKHFTRALPYQYAGSLCISDTLRGTWGSRLSCGESLCRSSCRCQTVWWWPRPRSHCRLRPDTNTEFGKPFLFFNSQQSDHSNFTCTCMVLN